MYQATGADSIDDVVLAIEALKSAASERIKEELVKAGVA